MLEELHIKKEGDSFTLEDQDGNWLQDDESLEDLLMTAKKFGGDHDIDTVIVQLDAI